jgi:hypothetical protein
MRVMGCPCTHAFLESVGEMMRKYSGNLRSWDRRICRKSHKCLVVSLKSSPSEDCHTRYNSSLMQRQRITEAQQRTAALWVRTIAHGGSVEQALLSEQHCPSGPRASWSVLNGTRG